MQATTFALGPMALIGVVLVFGLLAAAFSSRTWAAALSVLGGLLFCGVLGICLLFGIYSFRGGAFRNEPVAERSLDVGRPPAPPEPASPAASPSLPFYKTEAPGRRPLLVEAETPDTVLTTTAQPQSAHDSSTSNGAANGHGRLPEWVTAGQQRVGDVYHMPITIGPYTTRQECDVEQRNLLREAVDRYVNISIGDGASDYVNLQLPYIYQNIVRADVEEHRPSSVGPMLYVHNLLEFDRAVNDHIQVVYRQALVAERLKYAGIGTAGLFGLLATVFGYLKLDTLSRGYYTGRLRLAAAAAILGIVAGLLAVG